MMYKDKATKRILNGSCLTLILSPLKSYRVNRTVVSRTESQTIIAPSQNLDVSETHLPPRRTNVRRTQVFGYAAVGEAEVGREPMRWDGVTLRHGAGAYPGNFGWNTDISTSILQQGVSQFDKRYNGDVCEFS